MQRRLQTIAIATALTVLAALPRLYDLGFLSFYGDEQLTAMVSRSIAEGQGARMPSGMPYLRAVPLSGMAALSSEILGTQHEYAYRLPAAIFGILTVPLLFVLAQAYVGRSPAIVASVLLALADWHVVTSREARMYAPFLFCFIGTTFAAWHWTKKPPRQGLWLGITLVLFCATVAFHQLGILAVLMLPIPLAFIGWNRISAPVLFAVTTVCWLAAQYYNRIVSGNFRRWGLAKGIGGEPGGLGEPLGLPSLSPTSIAGALIGVALGVWVARINSTEDEAPGAFLRRLVQYVLAGLAGGLAGAGLLHAAGIVGLLLLIMHPLGGLTLARRAAVPITGVALLLVFQLASAMVHFGVTGGLKHAAAFPFPYMAQLLPLFPGVMLLFLGYSLVLAMRPPREEEKPLRACVLAAFAPAAAIGVVMPWGEVRYLIEVFPFMLLVASAGLVQLLQWIGGRRASQQVVLVGAIIIAASGLLGGHGLPQAWHKATAVHGAPQAYRNPYFFPDHKAPGEFVRSHRRPDDIVVTENALRQSWYVGPIDYWLRSPTGSTEVFRAPDGTTRDAYLNLVIPETAVLQQLERSTSRIWFISSAEHWEDYFSPEQAAWLDDVRAKHEPVFIGRDGVTEVYCINCDRLE